MYIYSTWPVERDTVGTLSRLPICLHLFTFSIETLAGFSVSSDVQYLYVVYIVYYNFPSCPLLLNKIKLELLRHLMLKSLTGAQSSSNPVSATELKPLEKQQ